MPDPEKEKTAAVVATTETSAAATATPATPAPAAKTTAVTEEASSQYFFGEPLVGFDPSEITGSLVGIEGMHGSGRATQIALLQEGLGSDGLAAAPDILAERAAGDGLRARIQKSPSDQLLGSRTGHVPFTRPLLVVHPLSDDDQARIRSHGQEA